MELKPYKKLTGLDFELSKTVQYTEEFLAQLTSLNFLVGNLIEISVTTTATSFEHKIGKTPVGWIIFDKNTNSNVWRTAWDDRSITLQASLASTIKVWVF
jgi:hypothetical protein